MALKKKNKLLFYVTPGTRIVFGERSVAFFAPVRPCSATVCGSQRQNNHRSTFSSATYSYLCVCNTGGWCDRVSGGERERSGDGHTCPCASRSRSWESPAHDRGWLPSAARSKCRPRAWVPSPRPPGINADSWMYVRDSLPRPCRLSRHGEVARRAARSGSRDEVNHDCICHRRTGRIKKGKNVFSFSNSPFNVGKKSYVRVGHFLLVLFYLPTRLKIKEILPCAICRNTRYCFENFFSFISQNS